MARPLLTLLVGVLVAVGIAASISPIFTWREAIGPVLITITLGGLVLGATARRAALREREQALQDAEYARTRQTHDMNSATTAQDEEADRG